MLKYFNFDVVFQEVPGEVSLAFNLTNCPNNCPCCHSPYLQGDYGWDLTITILDYIIHTHAEGVTTILFMGGDSDPEYLNQLLEFCHKQGYKTAWYSGKSERSMFVDLSNLDYLKLGPFCPDLGPLSSRTTNQRFYHITPEHYLDDLTSLFWK